MFQTVNDKVQILVPFISAEKTGFMISGKICTTQYMKKLQLDPLDIHGVQISHCFQDILPAFAGKPQDGVDDHFDAACAEIFHCGIKTGQWIAASYISGGIFMDSLESQLHPHRFDLVQGIKKIQYIISQTVRSGTNGQCHDIRMGDGFCEDLTQVFHRSVCVCICLKIGDIFMNRAFGRETFNLCVDLLCNGKSGVCCKISASALAAEDAAFFAQGAVTVGTGHAAV